MPNHKSAEKRVRQNAKRRARNRHAMSTLRTEVKKVHVAIVNNEAEAAEAAFPTAVRTLERAAAKGFIHRKTASRKVSRLAKALNKAKAVEA